MEIPRNFAGHRELWNAVYADFSNNPLKREMVTNKTSGANVDLSYRVYVVPEELKSKDRSDSQFRVGGYCPGIWGTKFTRGYSGETGLVRQLLAGELDVVVVAKPVGSNEEAYTKKNRSGLKEGLNQTVVGEVLADLFSQRIPDEYKDLIAGRELSCKLIGYSEGASQMASAAVKLADRGEVELDCFAPGGISGVEDQRTIGIKEVIENFSPRDSFLAPRRLSDSIRGYNESFFPHSIERLDKELRGSAKVNGMADMGNVIPSFISFIDPVQRERVRAILSRNSDYTELARRAIPTTVIIGTDDGFFNYLEVVTGVDQLKKSYPANKISLLTVISGGHSLFHKFPRGSAASVRRALQV